MTQPRHSFSGSSDLKETGILYLHCTEEGVLVDAACHEEHFLILTIQSTLILQVYIDGRAAHETLDESVAFPQKSQSSAFTNWRGKNMLTEMTQNGILVNRTLGDCVHLDLQNRKSKNYIHDVIWKKGQILIGKMSHRNLSTSRKSNQRCHVFNNGSLSLCPTLMEDVGHYTAETFTNDGVNLYSQTVQLVLTQPKPELEPEPKRKTNSSQLLFFILKGVHVAVFLIVLASSIYYFGKRKSQPVHWETGRNLVEYAAIYRRKQDQTLQQAVETTEGGQWSLIRNQEETTEAAGGSDIECPVSLNISTFQGKEFFLSQPLCMTIKSCSASVIPPNSEDFASVDDDDDGS